MMCLFVCLCSKENFQSWCDYYSTTVSLATQSKSDLVSNCVIEEKHLVLKCMLMNKTNKISYNNTDDKLSVSLCHIGDNIVMIVMQLVCVCVALITNSVITTFTLILLIEL